MAVGTAVVTTIIKMTMRRRRPVACARDGKHMNILGNMNIGKRLTLGFAVILAFSAVVAAISLWRLEQVSTATREMMNDPLKTERLMGDWYTNLTAGIRRTLAIAKSSDPSLAAYFAEEAAASSDKADPERLNRKAERGARGRAVELGAEAEEQLAQRQVAQQAFVLVLVAQQVQIGLGYHRLQQPANDQLGQAVGHAHRQPQGAAGKAGH